MALTNILQFQAGISLAVERADDRRRRIFRAIGMEALKRLVLNTRVKTGRARGNWQAAEKRPPSGEIDRKDIAGTEGTTDTFAFEGKTILAASGDVIVWLHNGVPYIGVLENKDKMLAGTISALGPWIANLR